MNLTKSNRLVKHLFAGIMLTTFIFNLESCSKKSGSSKSAVAATETPAQPVTPVPPTVEEKDGMQITRDASGNYVINLVMVNLQPVKLMKPQKEGYVVWVVTDAGVPVNVGTIEGANTWTDKKDKTKFVVAHPVKPVKVFVTAETDLKAQKPGAQVVWSTGSF